MEYQLGVRYLVSGLTEPMTRVILKVVASEFSEGNSSNCLGMGLTGILKKGTWKAQSMYRGTFLQVLMGIKGGFTYVWL